MSDLELLDCGDGRRLERFGSVVVDRPAPAATQARRLPEAEWAKPALRWAKGAWVRGAAADPWPVQVGGVTFECRPAAGGQVGLFPEHAVSWAWLDQAVRTAAERLEREPEVLSLFAYTGGATLACAGAGARVTHVDSSKPAVAWARQNAVLSGLAEAPVRWLTEDVRAYVRRERRRGRHYDGIVLDPPSYGHGEGAWRIEDDLPALMDDLLALCGARPSLFVLSAHTPGYDGDRLAAMVREHIGVGADGAPLAIDSRSGNRLELGAWARGGVHGPKPVTRKRPARAPRS